MHIMILSTNQAIAKKYNSKKILILSLMPLFSKAHLPQMNDEEDEKSFIDEKEKCEDDPRRSIVVSTIIRNYARVK